MRLLRVFGLSGVVVLSLGLAQPSANPCAAVGAVQFICDVISPEDLAVVPGAEWVIASGDQEGGRIHLVNVRDKTTTLLFPTSTRRERLDAVTYPTCPGPLPPEGDDFRAHGLYLTPGSTGVHTLYVVHHGVRESIEVFEVDARSTRPALIWIGCAIAPEPVGFNSVVALPDEGFVATSPRTGDVWEWHAASGTRQRRHGAQRSGDLARWPLALRGRVCRVQGDAVVAWSSHRPEGGGGAGLPARQSPDVARRLRDIRGRAR